MRHRLPTLMLLICLSAAFSAQTDQWKQYKSGAGNFSALFPGEPQDTVNSESPTMQSHTLMAVQKPSGYMVVYTHIASEQKVDEVTYQLFKEGFLKQLPNCEVKREEAPSPGLHGYIGHRYLLNCGTLTLAGNLYWGKHYAYGVMGTYPANVSEPANLKRFLDSFILLDAGS
jgi:hypothetical protein